MNIKKLIEKLDKFKIMNIIKLDDILLKRNKDKIESGEFISSEIVEYINNKLIYKY